MQGNTSLYGFTKETLDSLMLTLLPPIGAKYQLVQNEVNEEMDIKVSVLKTLVDALRDNAGFHIPKVLLRLWNTKNYGFICVYIYVSKTGILKF